MSGGIAIGTMRHRIDIEQPVHTADDGGGSVTTWAHLATIWAAIEPATAAEREVSGRLDGVVTHRITIRHRGDVVGGMRFMKDGRVFRVLAAHDPDERGRWTRCLTEEEGR